MIGLQDEIKRSADEYALAFKEVASVVYAANRAAAAETAREALQSTSNLAQIEPEAIKENPDRIEALCNMCLPPLSRDRLAALSGVPARRIMSLQRGELPSRYSSRIQLIEEDLPAICRVLSDLIDPDLAPWIGEGRPCTEGEEGKLIAIAADRMSAARARVGTAVAFDAYFSDRLVAWLKKHGYSERPKDGPVEAGTYAKEQRIGTLDVMPRGGGDDTILHVSCFADPSNAIRARISLERIAKAPAAGECFVYVLAGCVDTPLIAYFEKKGIDYVWAHDLDKLKEYRL